jgi:hypothetical protein
MHNFPGRGAFYDQASDEIQYQIIWPFHQSDDRSLPFADPVWLRRIVG